MELTEANFENLVKDMSLQEFRDKPEISKEDALHWCAFFVTIKSFLNEVPK